MAYQKYTDEFIMSAALMLEEAGYQKGEGAILYGVFEKGASKPFYIGSTKYDMETRFNAHMYAVQRGDHTNRHLNNKVRKIGVDNVEARLIHQVECPFQFLAEMELIKWTLGQEVQLTNRVHNDLDYEVSGIGAEDDHQPGMTPDRLEILRSMNGRPNIWWDKDKQKIADRLWDLLLLMFKQVHEKHENEARKEYPGFLEWYEEYTATNGPIHR